MASIGHLIVGVALSRFTHDRALARGLGNEPRRTVLTRTAALCGLSMLPDADVVAFALRIPYSHAFGHRGASHSIAFALVVGALCAAPLSRAMRLPIGLSAAVAVLAVVSHPLLDMLTDGGLGCALFWPVSSARHFFGIQPLPVAPIGGAFLSARGLWCVAVEVVLLSPLLVYAARPGSWRKRL